MPLVSGSKLGSYEILSPLGAGGMGEVYRARDPRLERDVAIKVLPPGLAANQDRLRRFQQEARAAAALNHPNILAVYELGMQDGAPYIVTELLPGQSLRHLLATGPLPPHKVVDYSIGIASGLAAAHEKGIVHRDLKPANVFVTTDHRVKILDFGLAKLLEPTSGEVDGVSDLATRTQDTSPGTVLGTVGYMAPEQVNGKTADHRSDIFSFGCVLYEMLAGRRAFRRETAAETMTAILKEDPPEVTATSAGVGPNLDRIIRHCLEKDPGQRFQSARDLAFNLEAAGGTSGGTKGSAAPAAGATTPRRLGVTALALLAVALAFVGGRRSTDGLSGSRAPSIRQLSFGTGTIRAARFAPDGQTIVFGAAWDGSPIRLFLTRLDSDEPTAVNGPEAEVLSISRSGEMAVSVGHAFDYVFMGQGTLARMPLLGGAPRALLERVAYADWTPDGTGLAVVRRAWAKDSLEFPIGRPLYESESWISYPRFSPKGDRIAFLDHRIFANPSASLVVVDLAGGKTTLAAEGWKRGLAWSPDGNEVWFVGSQKGEGTALQAVDMTGRERALLPLPGSAILLDVSREGRALLATEQLLREVHVLGPGQDRLRNHSFLFIPVARHMSADGRTLLITANSSRGPGVYLRRSDGSAPIRLGEGEAAGLSPDGSWAVSIIQGTPSRVLLLPTGPGQARTLPTEPLTVDAAKWLPDGKRLVLAAREPGRAARLLLQDLASGPPRAFTSEGIQRVLHSLPVSPDGRFVAAVTPGGASALYPVDGGSPQEVPGVDAQHVILGWTPDGRGLFVMQRRWPQSRIERLEIATGRLEPWKELAVSDPSGIVAAHINLSADGHSYAWTLSRVLGNIYLVEGLR